jgi:hypothetical protein
MFEPGFRVRGEISIVAEEALRGLEGIELDEVTHRTNVDPEWIERLHPIQLITPHEGVGEG